MKSIQSYEKHSKVMKTHQSYEENAKVMKNTPQLKKKNQSDEKTISKLVWLPLARTHGPTLKSPLLRNRSPGHPRSSRFVPSAPGRAANLTIIFTNLSS